MSKVHNFSAGPSILPQEVFQKASQGVLNFNNSGLSILEMSHRSKGFVAVMENARSLVKELLNVPDGYNVLFLQGGASLGFYIAAMNFLKTDGTGAYINTGTWAKKAIKEAMAVGNINVVASSEDTNFNYIPKDFELSGNEDFLHITTNNTIFGTQFPSIPDVSVPIIADMSSDIFSRPINVADYDLIYAGAQKNMGPAGTTLYIIKEAALGKTGRNIPTMLDLQTHIDKDSMFNTPPVFPIYVSMLVMEWIKENGGVAGAQARNQAKYDLLYGEIDRNPLFKGVTAEEDRSYMNATFVLADEGHKEKFDQMLKDANISGLNGHRSIGGYRASTYNALPLESVQVLVDTMKALEQSA